MSAPSLFVFVVACVLPACRPSNVARLAVSSIARECAPFLLPTVGAASSGVSSYIVQRKKQQGRRRTRPSRRASAREPTATRAQARHRGTHEGGSSHSRAARTPTAQGRERRQGIGGNILLYITLQTSLGSALHTRNFFQKCQLLGNDYKCVYLHRCRFLASNNVADAASTNFNFYRSWQIVVKFYNVKDSILLIIRYI